MKQEVLIKELMWEYNYTKKQAEHIVQIYTDLDKYDDLCDLIVTKMRISMSDERQNV